MEMLKFLAMMHTVFMAKLDHMLANTPDGNPKAQAKLAKQVEQVGYPFVLGTRLAPGKRGRYVLRAFFIGCHDPNRHKPILENDVIPEKPWLSLNVLKHQSKGRGNYDIYDSVIMFITHHALSRLCQRCGAREMADLLNAAVCICWAYIAKANADKQFENFRDGMRLPFEGGTAVLNHNNDEHATPVVVTML
jgi:hypothetical protein